MRLTFIGTPIHNTLADLFPVFQFLEIPYVGEWTGFKKSFKTGNIEEDAKKMQLILRANSYRRLKNGKINGEPLITLPTKVCHSGKIDI
jgi:SNF2 family DNA or RNA helicase